MNDKIKRLGDAELEMMLVIWDTSEPVTSNYILERLHGRRGWALSTLMTALARLAAKGFVYCDRTTRTNLYSALISAEEYKAKESRSILEKLYGNSLQNLVTSLYDSHTINDADLSELQKLIEKIERRKNNHA
ncbi:transcriptional repressor, CopY family [Syntrophobotulus glycolicus DSM 8271]|uniref:Transcriptional repressor, CopY family n=1 Tax=Syntrophobotulus glycolicus (strain DSM 8271 / FlGlyR) TaxID=645991 RepID=F0T1Z3_SYNGF|nr:BlaI/MecI/CopY family transcriptional regulator [Syntrophobotulus glycolicus]ADY55257.1 transcriptional repressor, CopY family [Syntrophobotulus glycolicus DSM 8271]